MTNLNYEPRFPDLEYRHEFVLPDRSFIIQHPHSTQLR